MMSGAMTENAYQLDEEIQRELKGRRTGIGPVANSGPASLPGREHSSSTCPGGCAWAPPPANFRSPYHLAKWHTGYTGR